MKRALIRGLALLAVLAAPLAHAQSAPTISKSFSPTTIQNGGTSTLTLVITNPNGATTLTGVAVSDTYPANLVNRNPSNAAISCTAGSSGTLSGGANGGNTIGMTGGSVLAGGSCTVTVRVTSIVNATYNNTTGAVTSINGGTGLTASASLVVQAAQVAPTISKVFAVDEQALNGVSTLTFNIANPNNSTLFNVAFDDTYPAGLVNATPSNAATTCAFSGDGGNAINGGVAGGNTIGLDGKQGGGGSPTDIPANTSCTVTVSVTSATAGTYNNTSANITARDANTGGAGTITGGTASATIIFVRPTITKAFSPTSIGSGQTSTLTLTLANASDVAFTINTPGFTDTFPVAPGAMTVASPLTTSNTCGGTLLDSGGGALAAGDVGIRLNGGSIPAHGSCVVSVAVTAAASGTYTNTVAAGNLSTSAGTNAAAASATLQVGARPTVAKAFSATNIPVLGTATLTITLSNNNTSAATSAAFTDTLPAGLKTSGAAATTCGGTASTTTGSVSLSGGTIPSGAPGTCTVTVTVQNDADTDSSVTQGSGVYTNTLAAGALSTNFGTNAAAATATINVIGGYKSVVLSNDADGSGTVTPGDRLTWSVFYRNPTGGANIASFQATDTIDTNTTFVAASISLTYTPAACSTGTANGGFNGAGNPNLFSAAFTLNAGCTARISYQTQVKAGVANATTISNQASGSGTGLAATLTDNIDATTTGLPAGVTPTAGSLLQGQVSAAITATTLTTDPNADLAITKTDGKTFAVSGNTLTYTITVTNNGPSNVTGATVADTFAPATYTVASISWTCVLTSGTGDCNTAAGGTGASGTGNISLPNVQLNSGAVITITASAPLGAAFTGSASNTATVTAPAGVPDGVTTNNSATDTTTVGAAISVTKVSALISDPVNGAVSPKRIPGALIEYTITLTASTVDADSVVMTDAIPTNTSFVSGSILVDGVAEDDDGIGADETDPNGADYSITAAGKVTATIATIAAGASKTVVFRVTVN